MDEIYSIDRADAGLNNCIVNPSKFSA